MHCEMPMIFFILTCGMLPFEYEIAPTDSCGKHLIPI